MVWTLISVMSPTSWRPWGLLPNSSVMLGFRHCRMGHVTPRKREKARVSVLTASSHLVLEILVNSIRQEREIKHIYTEKKFKNYYRKHDPLHKNKIK